MSHAISILLVVFLLLAALVSAQNETCPAGSSVCLNNPSLPQFGFACCDDETEQCTGQTQAYTILFRKQTCCRKGGICCSAPGACDCYYPSEGEQCCNSVFGLGSQLRPTVICGASQICQFNASNNDLSCRDTEEGPTFCDAASNGCSAGQACCVHMGRPQCYETFRYSCFHNLLCPLGLGACRDQCYNPFQYVCEDGMLCPFGHRRCGRACYDPDEYTCEDGTLQPL